VFDVIRKDGSDVSMVARIVYKNNLYKKKKLSLIQIKKNIGSSLSIIIQLPECNVLYRNFSSTRMYRVPVIRNAKTMTNITKKKRWGILRRTGSIFSLQNLTIKLEKMFYKLYY
jgi:hypothetical protein